MRIPTRVAWTLLLVVALCSAQRTFGNEVPPPAGEPAPTPMPAAEDEAGNHATNEADAPAKPSDQPAAGPVKAGPEAPSKRTPDPKAMETARKMFEQRKKEREIDEQMEKLERAERDKEREARRLKRNAEQVKASVSREEFDALKKEVEELRKLLKPSADGQPVQTGTAPAKDGEVKIGVQAAGAQIGDPAKPGESGITVTAPGATGVEAGKSDGEGRVRVHAEGEDRDD